MAYLKMVVFPLSLSLLLITKKNSICVKTIQSIGLAALELA